ncbi:MAG: M14 family zinc carboxypeptidase [Candidatus Cloacimonetes bacterium]|nr:M14 family zinc carboxypeptidase [Candidatus Cloacimonadota bacterium]
MKKYLFIALLITLALGLGAREWNQYYFQFELLNKAELKNISKVISIDKIKGNWVYAYANDEEWKAFQELGYKTRLLPAPSSLFAPVMSTSVQQTRLWDSYPTYEAYVATMNAFATNYPNLCQIVDTGTTVNGRKVLFAKISDNVSTHEAEPEVMYSSTMHGDEAVGFVLSLRLIDTLLSSYGTDPRITNIVNNMELWISPNTNPDGTYYGGNSSVSSARRANGNGYDLNRNFPVLGGGQPSGQPRQIETTNMMNFMQSHHFVFGANFHGGEEVVNYPWDYTYSLHPDDAWYISSSLSYANSAIANGTAGYFTGLSSNGITNGAEWYVIDGGRQDWVNMFNHGREVTIEISSVKLPAASTLPGYWNANYDAMLSYLEESLYGIHGIVHDPYGNPLQATISIAGHDDTYSTVITDPAKGDFYRYLNPGTYSLTISASGYPDKIVSGVVVNADTKTPLDITLGEIAHTQNISLQPGWNLLSFNIDLGSNDFTSVFGNNLQQIKNNYKTYSPGMESYFNTLGSLESAKGYWVNNTSSATLNVQGQLLSCAANPQSLQAGWNLVSYLPDTTMSISTALANIYSHVQEVRDTNNAWIAGSGGTLSQLQPGKAYWVKVSEPCSLIYP